MSRQNDYIFIIAKQKPEKHFLSLQMLTIILQSL